MKKLFASLIASLFFAFSMVGVSFAALPAGVDTALTAVQADAVSLMALVAPVVIAILGMTVVLKLIKRFTNKV